MKKLLIFKSVDCQPCKALATTMKDLQLDVEQITTVDVHGNREFTIEHSVRAVPTLILMQDGKELKRKTGAMTAEQLKEFVA